MGIWSFTCIVHCLAFLFGLINGSSFVLGARDVLDLLTIVKQTNYTLTYVSGSEPHMNAILFQDTNRILELPENTTNNVLMLLRNNEEFTFLATVRQEPGDSGSLISFSAGQHRLLEVESDGQRDEIHIHYPRDQHLYTETFPIRIADGHWHQLALTFSGNNLTLYINCSKRYQRVIALNRHYLAGSKLSLFIGQRNQNSLHFKGAIQELKFVSGQQGYRIQCPLLSELTTSCRNCAQFQVTESLQNKMNLLYNTFSKITLEGEKLTEVINRCKCMNTCSIVGNIWEKDECTICSCENNTVECRYNDECKRTCYYDKKYYKHNDVFCPGKTGELCTCDAGFINCEVCPQLDCDISEQVLQDDECCPQCKGTGFCASGNDCPDNSTCIDQQTKYTCLCNGGFHKNGERCEDVNECSEVGGPKGHHCSRDQTCVNTIGSYKCVCASGQSSKGDNSCSAATLSSGQIGLFSATWQNTWTNRIVIIVWLCLFVHHILR